MYQYATYECMVYKNENISSYTLVLKVLGQVVNSKNFFRHNLMCTHLLIILIQIKYEMIINIQFVRYMKTSNEVK